MFQEWGSAAPTANPQSLSVDSCGTLTVTLTGSDPDSDPLTYIISALPGNGNLYDGTGTGGTKITSVPYTVTDASHEVTYEPNDSSPDSFAFKVNDGVVDSTEATISITVTAGATQCVATSTGTGKASFTASQGSIVDLTGVPPPSQPPAGVTFPHGMFSFQITGVTPGDSVTLTITLPDPVPVGTKWWKTGNGHWEWLPIGSDDGDNTMTVTLTDGGTGDQDKNDNGSILDDGGPGEPGAVGWETYTVSKVRVLLPWIALGLAAVAGASVLVLRRRRAGA
jgi:hypothetical protein